jgi:hypothetical protein
MPGKVRKVVSSIKEGILEDVQVEAFYPAKDYPDSHLAAHSPAQLCQG